MYKKSKLRYRVNAALREAIKRLGRDAPLDSLEQHAFSAVLIEAPDLTPEEAAYVSQYLQTDLALMKRQTL